MPRLERSGSRSNLRCKTGAERRLFSAVVVTVAAATLSLAGCAAARSSDEGAPATEPVSAEPEASTPITLDPVTLAQEKVTGGWGEQIRRVVSDQASWTETWAELLPGRQAGPPPGVDFERSMVLVAALPTQHCDARITVRQVRIDRGVLAVDLLEELAHPGIRCFAATRPFHAVRVARPGEEWRGGETRFTAESRTYVAGQRTEP